MENIQSSDIEYLGTPLNDDSMAKIQKDSPGNIVVCHFLRPEKSQKDADALAKSNLYPNSCIASDSMPWQMVGSAQLIEDGTWPLPEGAYSYLRSTGTFSRFVKIYVRDQKKISLLEAVRKMSLIPAQILEKSKIEQPMLIQG